MLEALNRRPISSVEQIAERTGLPKATIVRMLQNLAAGGYAQQLPRRKGYMLGERVLNLSSGTTTQLTDHVGETAVDSFPTWVSATQIGFSSNAGGSDQVYVLPSNAVKTSGGFTLASAKEPWFGGGL